jgi:secreted PhoX family phosphatase
VPLLDPTPREDTLRLEARAAGAALVKRGEGACLADGALYFCATTGDPSPSEAGQILRLDDAGDGGTLEVYDRAAHDGEPAAATASRSERLAPARVASGRRIQRLSSGRMT